MLLLHCFYHSVGVHKLQCPAHRHVWMFTQRARPLLNVPILAEWEKGA